MNLVDEKPHVSSTRPLVTISGSLYFAGFGFVVTILAFYPGFMSPDSLSQYAASKSLVFSDWHPPVMAWVWSILNLFFDGPQGLLIFQAFLLWAGLLVWNQRSRDARHAWLILGIGLLPWVINFAGVLWKDVGMAFSLLLLTGIGLAEKTPARIAAAVALLFYALGLRHNAILAVVPILLLVLGNWFGAASKLKLTAMTAGVLIVVAGSGALFNYEILKTSRANPSNYMMLDDLSYLSIKKQESLLPGIPLADIQECAARVVGENRLVGRDFCLSAKDSYPANNPIANAGLKNIWLAEVARAPLDYAYYRLSAFAYLLRSPDAAPFYYWHPGIDANNVGLKQERNGTTIVVDWFVHRTAGATPFLFKPYWWLWFSCMLLLFSFASAKTRSTAITRALLVSSILYILGYIPSTPMADFRYIYWSVIATSLAAVLTVIDRPQVVRPFRSRRNLALAVTALGVTLLLFNVQRIFNVNVDKVLQQSLAMNDSPIGRE